MRAKLQKVPIFAGLDEAAVDFLWARVTESKFVNGSVIIAEGEPGNRFFLVGEGSVRVCRHLGQPNEIELGRMPVGDFFGEMCILETLPRSATVQAMADTMVYSLSSMAFYALYQAMPAQYGILILNIARDLSRRLRGLHGILDARH
jgi:CRP/FNR family cyclic AMP-dependent transcriptional regulator